MAAPDLACEAIRKQLPENMKDWAILAGPMESWLWPVKLGKLWSARVQVIVRSNEGELAAVDVDRKLIPIAPPRSPTLDNTEQTHPFASHDDLNEHIYETARKVDRLLNKEPIANHAAILGLIQVTTQRRMHEHENDQKAAAEAIQKANEAERRFGVH